MGNVKGIILNGEWLGSNVVINEMFNVIYSISPVIMLEFIHIVNDIENLENAIQINNFNYNKKNVVDIEFSNKELNGLASLLFEMKDGKAKLLNSFLKVNRGEELEQKVIKPVKQESEEVAILKEISAKLSSPLPVQSSVERYDNGYGYGYNGYGYGDAYNNGYGEYDEYGNYNDGYSDGYQQEYDEYGNPVDDYYQEDDYYNEENENSDYENSSYSDEYSQSSENYGSESIGETSTNEVRNKNENTETASGSSSEEDDEEEIEIEIEGEEETVIEEVVNEDGEVVIQEVKKPKTKKVKKSKKVSSDSSDNENSENTSDETSDEKSEKSEKEKSETDSVEKASENETTSGDKNAKNPTRRPGENGMPPRMGADGRPMNRMAPDGRRPFPPMGPNGRPLPPGDPRNMARRPMERPDRIPPERKAEPERSKRDALGSKKTGQEVIITIENAEINVTHSGVKGDMSGASLEIKNKDNKSVISVNNDNVKTDIKNVEPVAAAPAPEISAVANAIPNAVQNVQPAVQTGENLMNAEEQRMMMEQLKTLKEELQNLQQNQGEGQPVQAPVQDGPRMTLEEFLEQQRKKKESKVDSFGYKFKIIGSNTERMQAEVLDEGIFIANDKIYKWGEMLHLEN